MSAVLNTLSRYPESVALIGSDTELTYRQLDGQAAALAALLKDAQAVAICMHNSPQWIVADLACIRAGVVCVPLPPFFSEAQIAHALSDAGVNCIITDQSERFAGLAEPVLIAGKTYSIIKQNRATPRLPGATAKVTYTSGTTGTPKGVCLTQNAMETVAESLLSVLGPEIAARHVCLLPLAILLENVAGVYTALLAGATVHLPPVRHEPKALVQAVTEANATSCILVPELLRMLVAAGTPLQSLKFAAVGGARVDSALLEAARIYGIPAYEGYGLSEAASVVALSLPHRHRASSVGRPLPHVELKVSEEGEILLKNPLYSGYTGSGEAVPKWYATGDLGHIDEEGFIFIKGRRKNAFITSFGRNVSPEWPESLLTSHFAILQAAVFGEARPFNIAVLVARDESAVPAAIEQINQRLPDYARIGRYITASVPFTLANGQLTGNGRIRREAVYAAYQSHIECLYTMEKSA